MLWGEIDDSHCMLYATVRVCVECEGGVRA